MELHNLGPSMSSFLHLVCFWGSFTVWNSSMCLLFGKWITPHCMFVTVYQNIVNEHLGGSYLLALVKWAAMHTLVHVFVYVFSSLGLTSRIGVTGSHDNSVKSLKDCQAVLHCGWIILHSHQQWVRVPISPHPPSSPISPLRHFIRFRVMFHCGSAFS